MADPFLALDRTALRAAPNPPPAKGMQAQIIGRPATGGRSRWAEYLKAYHEMPALRVVTDVFASQYAAVRWKVMAPAAGAPTRRSGWLTGASAKERRREVRALVAGGELREIDAHLFFGVWQAGNKELSGFQQRRLAVVYRLCAGEAPFYLARNGMRKPAEAWILPPTWVRQTPIEQGTDNYWVQSPGGGTAQVPRPDILMLKEPDVTHPYARGVGVAKSVATELDTDEDMAIFNRTLFANSTRPELLVFMDGAQDPELKAASKKWAESLSGEYRFHQTHFLGSPEGAPPPVITDLSKNMRDLLFTDNRQQNWDFVRHVLARCPPELVGQVQDSNRATIEAARYIFASGTLVPMLEDDRERLESFCREEYDERIVLEYENPTDADWEFRKGVMSAASWAFTADEWRDTVESPPLPDGKGQVYMVPLGLTPVTDLGADPFAGSPPPERPPAASSDEDPEPAPERSLGDGPWAVLHRSLTGELRAVRPNAAIDRIAQRHGRLLESAWLSAIREGRRQIDVDALAAALAADDIQGALDLLPYDTLAQRMAATEPTLRSALQAAGESAAERLAQQLGDPVTFDGSRADARRWPVTRSIALRRWLPESARAAAETLISEEYLTGMLTAEQAASAVRARFGLTPQATSALGKELAELGLGDVARAAHERNVTRHQVLTRAADFGNVQGIGGSQEGQNQSWRQAKDDGHIGDAARQVWLTRDIGEECERCDPLHGQQRAIGEAFDSIGAPGLRIMHPGDAHEGWASPCYCGKALIAFG